MPQRVTLVWAPREVHVRFVCFTIFRLDTGLVPKIVMQPLTPYPEKYSSRVVDRRRTWTESKSRMRPSIVNNKSTNN